MRQELERLLDTHRAQRPEMQPQDYYKLLYQREFGCGHTAPAPETAGRHLMEEYARAAGLPGADAVPEHVKGAALPGCVEDIGNGLCRIYLNGAWSREVLRLLGRVFCATAREHKGETACFAAALDGLAHWADAVLPPRDAQTLRRQTGTLRAAGCPAVHHSAAYREQYAPHYRVVRRCYADAWPALLLAQRVLESVSPGGHALLAIDGRCGSGKSTLAAHMAQVFGWTTRAFLPFRLLRRRARLRCGNSRRVLCRCGGQLFSASVPARALYGLGVRHLRAGGTARPADSPGRRGFLGRI